jgi:hypothetical protein
MVREPLWSAYRAERIGLENRMSTRFAVRLGPALCRILFVAACSQLPAQAWTHLAPANSPPPRRFSALTFDRLRERAVLFGGLAGGVGLADTWLFDGANWSAAAPVSSPAPRQLHAMCYDIGRARVVLYGGIGAATVLADTWEFDGTNWQQVATSTSPTPRFGTAMAHDPARRRTVLFGGETNSGMPLSDTWEYDGQQWVQVATSVAPPPRGRHALVHDEARGQTTLFGGFDWVLQLTMADTWTYDGTAWTQIIGAAPPARSLLTATYHRDIGRMVVHGGFGGSFAGGHGGGGGVLVLADTWAFDGAAWTQTNASVPGSTPPARIGASTAFDSSHGDVILFGGGIYTLLPGGGFMYAESNDTWVWRPANTASTTRFGIGCAGSAGTPQLDAAPGSLPRLGATFRMDLTSLPTGAGLALVEFGRGLVQAGGLTLPLDLDASRPHCLLWIEPDPALVFFCGHGGGSTQVAFAVPATPSLAGLTFGGQAAVLDVGVALGYTPTNGVIVRLQ